jgi:hypothetical protein
MRGWKRKLTFLLIVYFAGFATAIYTLAPPDENSESKSVAKRVSRFEFSDEKSEAFKEKLAVAMQNCLATAKDAGSKASIYIRQKLEDSKEE